MAPKLLLLTLLPLPSLAFVHPVHLVQVIKTTQTDILHLPPPSLNLDSNLIHAQQQNPGATACVAANSVLSSCSNRGVLATTAPAAPRAQCLCCFSSTALYPVYSACASYIFKSAPTASNAYTLVSELWDACSGLGTGVCNNAAGATPTLIGGGNVPSSTPGALSTPAPAGCTSLVVMVESCSRKFGAGAETARADQVAGCLCADGSGNENTAIERYASSCAPWAKTAVSEDYEVITLLQTICDYATPGLGSSQTTKGGAGGGGIVFTPIVVSPESTPTPAPESTGSGNGNNNPGAGSNQGGGGDGSAASSMMAPVVMAWIGSLVLGVGLLV
ncbi:hypothetical protein QBC38DRAFT_473992 [Podospora fimiseda]|uniref:Extracellular membrane protein CFEM domain-containing protein n=1 Tax=Podospora fimiseda TaxID=252190 RepID=A0AAN7BSJ5_9PEZI|nr:hypothetical protein QBC38DRAFT_473992 [Podospora fimiseda]